MDKRWAINYALREALKISSVALGAWLGYKIVKKLEDSPQGIRITIKKEGNMRTFNAESLNLSHLNPNRVSYEPKNIHTEAIQVTPENIGKLALEFETELLYDQHGRPYFFLDADRFDLAPEDQVVEPTQLVVRLSDWLVPLRRELHLMRDVDFQNTFTFDVESTAIKPLHAAGNLVSDAPRLPGHSSGTRYMPVEEKTRLGEVFDLGEPTP